MFGYARKFFRDFLGRQHKVNIACRYCAAWHAVVLRRFILSKSDPTFALYGLQAERSVGGRPGQNHSNGLMSLIRRERFEESINRAVLFICFLAWQQL